MTRLTRHAAHRAQQRGISGDALGLLLAFGEERYDGRGGVTCILTRKSIEAIQRAGEVLLAERARGLRGLYLVEAGDTGEIVTCGWRYARVKGR